MIPSSILKNQALSSHALFFDPVNRDLERYTDENGRPMGRYTHKPTGVEVTKNGDAIFTFWAPKATTVEVLGCNGMGNKRHSMQKINDEYWQVTLSDIPAGFYYHEYFVDGNRVCNDLAPYGFGGFEHTNFFEMPAPDQDFYLLQDVAHGTVRMEYYHSCVTERVRTCFVYTPPGYETSNKRYPVLYLQHGGGESESGWVWQGKINYILDNLLSTGTCKEMIVVMNTGYAFHPDGSGHPFCGCLDEVLTKDCIPFIDKKYRTLTDRNNRAMAGLSMGAFQTQRTVLHHLDLFSAMGMFSGVVILDDGFENYETQWDNAKEAHTQLDLCFIGVGEQEPVFAETVDTVSLLNARGNKPVFYSTAGFHEWQVWRHCVYQFLQLVFQS